MSILDKAKGWFKKKAKTSVYFRVQLDGPILGVSLTQPAKPWICVQEMSLEEAAQAIPRIDWHTVPMHIRSDLELGNQCMTVNRVEAKVFLKV